MENLTKKEKQLVNQNLAKEIIERLGKHPKSDYVEMLAKEIEKFENYIDNVEGKSL